MNSMYKDFVSMFIFRYSKFLHNPSEDEWTDKKIVKDIDNREVNFFFLQFQRRKYDESRKLSKFF